MVRQRNHRLQLAQSGLFGSLMHSDLSRLGYICLVEKSSQFFLFKNLILAFYREMHPMFMCSMTMVSLPDSKHFLSNVVLGRKYTV